MLCICNQEFVNKAYDGVRLCQEGNWIVGVKII